MTIPTNQSRNDYIGTGLVDTYPYEYKILDDSDLLVTKNLAGIASTLALGIDYTVTGAGDSGGGDVVLSADLEDTAELTIRRVVEVVQETDLSNQGTYFPEVLEDALDRLVMIDLQQEDGISRSIKLPETEAGEDETTVLPLAADRANMFFAWDSQGRPIAAVSPTGLPTVSAFMTTMLDDADEVTARQTLLLDKKGADVASAASVNLNSTTGDLVDLTGSTTVTGITLAEGVEKVTRTTGAPLLTNGASLVLPGGVNIQAAAGDIQRWRGYASGVVRLVGYLSASGAAQPGGVTTVAVDISPSQITANQNDYNPASLATASVLRLSSDARRNVTGLQGGADGRVLVVHNVGTFPIPLTFEDAASSAANRFAFGWTLGGGQTVELIYDGTSSRWRLKSCPSDPVGAVREFGGGTVPAGYLERNGQNVSRTTYASLFNEWGTTWGVGDGSTTFGVGDDRRRVGVGAGGAGTGTLGNAVGNTGGAETHTLTLAEIAAHSHTHPAYNNGGAQTGVNAASGAGGGTQASSTDGGGGAHNNMQPSYVVTKIAKF